MISFKTCKLGLESGLEDPGIFHRDGGERGSVK